MKILIILTTILISSTSFAAPKLHVILSADSSAKDIGKSVAVDKRNMNKLFAGIAEYFNDSDIYSLSTSSLSEGSIKNKIKAMNIGRDDVVVFYYSGHGDRSKKSADWPVLTPANGQKIEVLNILLAINAAVPRQVVTIIDACNGSYSPLKHINRAPASTFNSKTVDALFKKFKGSVVITSSEPGFVSYTIDDNEGSLFSYMFERSLKKHLSSQNTSWDSILKETKNKVYTNDNAQTPKFKLKSL